MIKSYHDKKTRLFASGERVREFESFKKQAEKRLEVLEAASSLDSLRMLRSNRLEVLKGNREGQYSIRINNKWRVCFAWSAGLDGPEQVEIVDYH